MLRRAATRGAGVGIALVVAMAGLVVVGSAAPAGAATRLTPYGFEGSVFGTRIISRGTGVSSGRSAWSPLACTKVAGLTRQNSIAQVSAEQGLQVGAVRSTNTTYRAPGRGIVAGIRGFNRVADVRIGAPEGPYFALTGLQTRTDVWRRKNANRFDAKTTFTSSDIDLKLAPDAPTPLPDSPLDDLLDQVGSGIGGVLDALRENGGKIEIPGLGTVHQGWKREIRRPEVGVASGYLLRVVLTDGTEVQIGRSYSKMVRDLPAGPMRGSAMAVQLDALGGVLKSGRIAEQPLPCDGTAGQVRVTPLAAVSPGGLDQLSVGAGRSEAWGIQRRTGFGRAWTRSTISTVTIGGAQGIIVNGLRAQANVLRTARGRIFANAKGTSLGDLTIGGSPAGALPTAPFELPDGTPVLIQTNLVERLPRGIRVTALKITLLPGTPGETTVRLGNANAVILRK